MGADSSDPADLGVLEAAAELRDGRLSAAELLASVSARIEARNGGPPSFDGEPGAINAWVRLYPELAAQQAAEADQRLAREGEAAPLLCGVPIGLKDLYAVAGLPVTASSRVLEGNAAREDAESWSRLRRHGMVLVGHTHTHEFAFGGTTDQVGNPWALERSAGGSSGGSAAALAAGMVPAATGTDTAGSLRIPAAKSGVSSIKATFGRVPMRGVLPLADSLDHAGPMARSVADCAVLLEAMTDGPEEVSAQTAPPPRLGPLPRGARAGSRPLAGTRIARLGAPPQADLDPDVVDALEAAAAACRRLGAELIEPERPLVASVEDFYAIGAAEIWSYHEQFADRAGRYRPGVAGAIAGVARAANAGEYVRAQRRRRELGAAWERWLASERVDLLLEPTLVAPAQERTLGYAESLPIPDPWIMLTFPWDMTGFPVATMPAGLGRRSGLPIGVSLIARRGDEVRLVQAAIDLQEHELEPPRLELGR